MILLPGGVMVAPENLDLVVQVRVLAGQFIYESIQSDYFSSRQGYPDEIRNPKGAASGLRQAGA